MISGLPRPATTGSASLAPAAASLRSSGSGLISVLSGEKPDTIDAGLDRKRERPRRDRLGRGLPLGGGHRIAPRERGLAQFGLAARRSEGSVINRAEFHSPTEARKCGAAMAVGA